MNSLSIYVKIFICSWEFIYILYRQKNPEHKFFHDTIIGKIPETNIGDHLIFGVEIAEKLMGRGILRTNFKLTHYLIFPISQ
ncbi:MAG: hypothetical protein COS90_07750 [Deltaproteobacteria bacterium CG07_land_8_20_14_0_80_60_11]|nr:MAG: hypothetical protein COS90_07750 [Deltaproteobacteria bacterium CG07_land_8_20_14_0_80_60_11]